MISDAHHILFVDIELRSRNYYVLIPQTIIHPVVFILIHSFPSRTFNRDPRNLFMFLNWSFHYSYSRQWSFHFNIKPTAVISFLFPDGCFRTACFSHNHLYYDLGYNPIRNLVTISELLCTNSSNDHIILFNININDVCTLIPQTIIHSLLM